MSYINDALNKVQKEKESPYAAYGGVLLAESKKPAKSMKWIWAAGFLAFFIAVGLAVLFYGPETRKTPRAEKPSLPPVVAAVQAAHKALPDQRAGSLPDVRPVPAVKMPEMVGSPLAGPKESHPDAAGGADAIKQDTLARPTPVDPEILYQQALQKQREGKLEEAKDLYRQVIKTHPRHLQALNNLGVVYLKLKRYKWAIIRLNDAIDLKYDYVDAHYNLACLYAQKNDTKKSLFYLKNAIEMNPEVRKWAAGDEDLKNLAGLPEFNKILQARDK